LFIVPVKVIGVKSGSYSNDRWNLIKNRHNSGANVTQILIKVIVPLNIVIQVKIPNGSVNGVKGDPV
jgi:hypothetical protein